MEPEKSSRHNSSTANRVKSIRSKFETLCHLEHLDIPNVPVRRTQQLPDPSSRFFPFRRSATTINFTVNKNKENNDKSNESIRKLAKIDLTKTLGTSKLNRHTSDPIKRSSIRRSPAFRVGESQNKVVLTKTNSLTTELEAGLTDTLKKALKQPLPRGPPPKKPPRLLAGSPSSSTEKPLPIEEESQSSSDCSGGGWQKFTNGVKSNLNGLALKVSKTTSCINGPIYDAVAEPIYMEPFQHLKMHIVPDLPSQQRRFSMDSMIERKSSSDGIPQKLGSKKNQKHQLTRRPAIDHHEEEFHSMNGSVSSTCSCPEQLSTKKPDLHYMVCISLGI